VELNEVGREEVGRCIRWDSRP